MGKITSNKFKKIIRPTSQKERLDEGKEDYVLLEGGVGFEKDICPICNSVVCDPELHKRFKEKIKALKENLEGMK